ncbi:MAG: hypothetical protein K2Y37_27280 [Pirellulales bacterium]|nr:hypothetical protein [Pirellulales bacterium]
MKYFTFALVIGAANLFAIAFAEEPSPQEEAQRKRDQIHIAVQEICPVSGEKLGEHGAPIKSKIGEETVFLCCKGCLEDKVDPEHWATIHANFAKAQRICPVMKKELPKNAKWTIIEGQIVYVCCPPCTKKIAAAPERFLKQLDELYTASLNARRDSR